MAASMAWVRIDDGFARHPKVVAAGPLAMAMQVAALCYCNRELTDGFIPRAVAKNLLDFEIDRADGVRYTVAWVSGHAGDDMSAQWCIDIMVESGMWREVPGGYQIHDYHDYQPSKEEVLSQKTMAKTRKELYADPGLVQRVRQRDQSLCRYCGVEVRWTDRKSALGGTYDHVIPDGGNSESNLVVACRGCNSAKGQRTPEQWGRSILDAGTRKELNPNQDGSGTVITHPYPNPVPVPEIPNPNPEPIRRAPHERRARADYPPEFEQFWATVVRQEPSKSKAFEAWQKAQQRTDATPEEIYEGLMRVVPAHRATAAEDITKVPHITTWLNQDRWTVQRPAMPARASPNGTGPPKRASAYDILAVPTNDEGTLKW